MCTGGARPQPVADCSNRAAALQWRMPALTRRRYPERPDCWHVYYGDVHVGTIASRAGAPVDVDQWGWDCGFYPGSRHGRQVQGTAETFEETRADFEAAWREYLPTCSQAEFEEHRCERARTAWKFHVGQGLQDADAIDRWPVAVLCGEPINTAGVDQHVYAAHMEIA
ncbi:hypothetical protein SAMN05444169_5595 [Bradyrhizobium erythrophlei]|jgi:hypothetical protein|uniref:Uncharacterized protein n=2 Tax=Bradyrhizobium erythrophlei TaxID=1437360 RepID=A0A1M5PZC3_9BRAD|nr:hypothetical protein SAMN05444169_5595 [Bradyrhizobium erythrophlei]